MQRRYLIIATALVLTLALAVPTIGAQHNNRALRTAKDAKRIAKTAKRKAEKAQNAAGAAQASANAAGEQAAAVEAELAAQRAKTRTAGATVTTAEEAAFVDLGGPSVTVTVPESGLIEVWVQATIADGIVSLYEDGNQVPGQDPNDVCSVLPDGLLSVPTTPALTTATPGDLSFTGGCGGFGAPAPVLFETTPGQHTYSLRYADCGCDPADAEFSDRSLTVAPRP